MIKDNIVEKVKIEADSIDDLEELTNRWRYYLGRKGLITHELRKIGRLPKKERKKYAIHLQKTKDSIQTVFDSRKKSLQRQFEKELQKKQTESIGCRQRKVGHLHPLTETTRMINRYFIRQGYSVVEDKHLETDEYNCERLNLPKGHSARDLQDTIYIKAPEYLLRTQTSSVEARILEDKKPPIRVVCSGCVYRNEKVNKSNHFIFNHYQGVLVDKNVTLKDLIGTLDAMFKFVFGKDIKMRYRQKYYPEVMIGVGPDMLCFECKGKGCGVCKSRGWIEAGGAGVIHARVLEMAGIDNSKWSGFAFGLGLDRLAMARHNISDIRKLSDGSLIYKPYYNENTL